MKIITPVFPGFVFLIIFSQNAPATNAGAFVTNETPAKLSISAADFSIIEDCNSIHIYHTFLFTINPKPEIKNAKNAND